MTDKKPEKQIWTSPSLESLDMKATAIGEDPSVENDLNLEGALS